MAEITITSENFHKEVLESELPVLVDFWAEWCGPCMMLAPTVAELAEEYEGKLKVGKINVDDEPSLAVQFGVSSIPTLMTFKNGEHIDTSVGYKTKEQLVKLLDL